MICSGGSCQLTACMDNHHINENTCEADSETACGVEAKDCTADAWWDGGDCIDGKCIPNACKGDYHLAQNELGKNWCEPNNDLNCGEHGLECTGGQQCVGGRCLGNTICDGVLRNTLIELDHCGDCSHRCDDSLICDQGQCKLGNGTAYCSGTKVTMGTIDRCSSCTDKCADGKICQNNACVAGAGMTYCSGATIDTRINIDHCGDCNHKCGEGLICSEGTCKAGNGLMYCHDVKITSTNDSANCSGCDNLCPIGSRCGTNSGVVTCIEGIGSTYCNGVSRNTSNDSANCGQCGKMCSVGEICQSGVCTTGTASTYCNGVSRNTSNDSTNCGQCEKVCGVGEICSNGVCITGTGSTYCDGVSRNTSDDSANCGQCGKMCSVGEICQSGVCTAGTGTTYCDGVSRNTSNDSTNCGQCKKVCDVGEICSNGVCTIGTGSTYCDGTLVNTRIDKANCAQCGNACASEEYCISATCTTTGTITFGNYYQSNATTKEPIQWRILEIDSVNHKMLLLSEYVLDAQAYHRSLTSITWANSSLRTWLNVTFMAAAFNATEQASIQTTHLDNPNNHGTEGGVATDDKVFLLGLSDIYGENYNYSAGNWYFNNDNDRRAMATWYAVVKRGASALVYNNDNSTLCNKTNFQLNKCSVAWWLRSPNNIEGTAVCVDGVGSMDNELCDVDFVNIGVRPALWVNY